MIPEAAAAKAALRGASALALVLALTACGPGDGTPSAQPHADAATAGAAAPEKPGLVDPRPLQGAGAVAFDPAGTRLAWASNSDLRVFDLAHGSESQRIEAGAGIGDVAFAPDGAMWLLADGEPQLWRDGAQACTADGVEADRLLAVDDEGAVFARYTHSDGVGMLRRQVWLDAHCAVADERIDPVPVGVTDSDADPGAPFARDSLLPVHAARATLAERLSHVQLPAGAGVEQAVAISPDGAWWVLEGAQGRTLWRRDRS